jgi:hypothetical protein
VSPHDLLDVRLARDRVLIAAPSGRVFAHIIPRAARARPGW